LISQGSAASDVFAVLDNAMAALNGDSAALSVAGCESARQFVLLDVPDQAPLKVLHAPAGR
jgi:hypothetical protein